MKGEKLPLFFVGKSKKPHCFKNIALDKQDFYYGSNKAGWMTTKLFRDWLKKINTLMSKEERKILLLMDNSPTHKILKFKEDYSNIKCVYIPPNTSALIQPIDMGIIKCIKTAYREKLGTWILANEEKGNLELKKIKILDTIIWVNQAWKNLQTTTIVNCWKRSGLYKNVVSLKI